MAYNKTNWVDGQTPLSALNMNKIETGIEGVEAVALGVDLKVINIENGTTKVPKATQADSATNATNATNATTAGTAGTAGSCTGNSATATKLQTARTINGVAFDGTANITVADGTKAPINHASSGTGYGDGTPALFGHCKTINDLTQSSHINGTALSAYQGHLLNQSIGLTPAVLIADLNLGLTAKTQISGYLTGAYDKYLIVLESNLTFTTTGTSSTRSVGAMLTGSSASINDGTSSSSGTVFTGVINIPSGTKTLTVNKKFFKEFSRNGGYYYNTGYSTSLDSFCGADAMLNGILTLQMPITNAYAGIYLQMAADLSVSGTLKLKIYGQNFVR